MHSANGFEQSVVLQYDPYLHSTVYRNPHAYYSKYDKLVDSERPLKCIFDLLNFEDQRQARLVCKKWHHHISQRPEWKILKSFNPADCTLLKIILSQLMTKALHAYNPLIHKTKPCSYKIVFFENEKRLKDVKLFTVMEEGKENELSKLIKGKITGQAEVRDAIFHEKIVPIFNLDLKETLPPFTIIQVRKMALVQRTDNENLDCIVNLALHIINAKLESKAFIEEKKKASKEKVEKDGKGNKPRRLFFYIFSSPAENKKT